MNTLYFLHPDIVLTTLTTLPPMRLLLFSCMGEFAKVPIGHTTRGLQSALERGGEGKTRMLHHLGAAVRRVVASHQGGWGSARESTDYILYLNGSFKREWLQFP